jgi:antitoxin CcdA
MKSASLAAAQLRQRRTATNVSARQDIVHEARELGLNLSRVFENALQGAIREERRRRWIEENRDAIHAYNARVDDRGVFSDAWRTAATT